MLSHVVAGLQAQGSVVLAASLGKQFLHSSNG